MKRLIAFAVLAVCTLAGSPRGAVAGPGAAQPELDRPVFGARIKNKTWRSKYLRRKYIWTDPYGKRWVRRKRVYDGELITLHIEISAIDIPKAVMGIQCQVVFPRAATTGDMAFPVKTTPMQAGDSRNTKIVVHVPAATIEREGGNWLRKIKTEALAGQIEVRPVAVRFMDGSREAYRTPSSVPTGLKPAGAEEELVVHGPPPGFKPPKKKSKSTKFGPQKVKVVPYGGGRVWVKPYTKKNGTHVRGHWRRAPSR